MREVGHIKMVFLVLGHKGQPFEFGHQRARELFRDAPNIDPDPPEGGPFSRRGWPFEMEWWSEQYGRWLDSPGGKPFRYRYSRFDLDWARRHFPENLRPALIPDRDRRSLAQSQSSRRDSGASGAEYRNVLS